MKIANEAWRLGEMNVDFGYWLIDWWMYVNLGVSSRVDIDQLEIRGLGQLQDHVLHKSFQIHYQVIYPNSLSKQTNFIVN